MVIASGNKRSPRRRAQRGRLVHVVTKAVVRDPLEVRGLDRSAEGAACSEAHVVRKDQQNVRRSRRSFYALWKIRRRIFDRSANLPLEGRFGPRQYARGLGFCRG